MSDSNNNEPVLNHEYDGIRELDYPLPTWWLATFFITIIFGTIYYLHYESSAGPSSEEELQMGLAKIEKIRQAAAASAPEITEEVLLALTSDPAALEKGKAEYIGKCAACHANEGGGLIGPNLTDLYWKNTKGTLVGLHKVIVEGITVKGMPAWKGLISDENIKNVTAYVATLKGTNPANAKAPEGEKFE